MSTVRDAVHRLLLDHGITRVFGNPGSTEVRFFRDWPDELDYVLGLQEASVVAMADGFAQASGQVGVAVVHSAAGLGHGLGSLYTAERNQTPLLVIAGQQTRSLLGHDPYLFARDAEQFPRPYAKYAVEPSCPEQVPDAIAEALRIARQAPAGPVFVSVPEDDWDRPFTGAVAVTERPARPAVDPDLDALVTALDDAVRPALVLGAAVEAGGGRSAAVELAERLGADVFTAPLAGRASFPEDHPRFAGFLQPVAALIRDQLDPYDVVLVAGAPVFTVHVPSEGPPVGPDTRLFHLTDDPRQIERAMAGEAVVAAAGVGLGMLADRVHARPQATPSASVDRPAPAPVRAPDGALAPERVFDVLDRLAPEDAVFVEEAPTHRNAMHRHLTVGQCRRFHVAASGSLGWGMPAAVGIALARPDDTVICVIGDGSSLYSIQALWTAAQRGARVLFVVLDNGGYAAMKAFGRRLGVPDAPGLDLPGVAIGTVAEGFGVGAAAVASPDELEAALQRGLETVGPSLVTVRVGAAAEDLY